MELCTRRCVFTDLRSLLVICLLPSLHALHDWADYGQKPVGDSVQLSKLASRATRLSNLLLAVGQISARRRFVGQMQIKTLHARIPENIESEVIVYEGFPGHVSNLATKVRFPHGGELRKIAKAGQMFHGLPDFFRLPYRHSYDQKIRQEIGDSAQSFITSDSARKQSSLSHHVFRSSPRWQKRTSSALCSPRHVNHRWLLEFFRTGQLCKNHIVRVRFGIGR
ncbi:hypothetical protein Btru_057902 [Bulinus truncatus]|nr:hypothetical protein Btru_057902 [Bulinus truncatus]